MVTTSLRLDNKNWMTYPAGGVIFAHNGIVYFRSKDADGAYSPVISYQVSNIDKTPPEAPVAQAEYGNGCVIVSAEFSAPRHDTYAQRR